MNFSYYFIKRPIFAGVLSIAIFVMGLLAMFKLPIGEYPEVVPPTIVVRATYPGATPEDNRGNRRVTVGTGHQRRGRFALHVFAGDRRRRIDCDGDVQSRHGHGQGTGAGAEPRFAGAAKIAGGSPRSRRHDDQAIARPHDGRPFVFTGQTVTTMFTSAITRRCR